MKVRLRLGARISAAVVAIGVPFSMTGLMPVADITEPGLAGVQQHNLGRLSPYLKPPAVAEETTIAAGLSLRTKADRNRKISLTSAKGSHVWTASALAEHGLPSAAMRAYKHAAATINDTDAGCRLPWTLLAGIGRVESDHGRYGGSVLGNDGVPRPAIVGIALNGVGPVAAIRDSDNGAFDGDTVWDRAVGPMQFIPTTWAGAGRDGDGDGKKSPNDIDDASLAAAGYLCGSGGDLSDIASEKAAVFRYNPSDYYVALVMAFARGYETGVFVIPSPEVGPNAGDGVVHVRAEKKPTAKKPSAQPRATRTGDTSPVLHPRPKRQATTGTTSTPKPKPKPKPTPPPPAPSPSYQTVRGELTGNAPSGPWSVGGKSFTLSGASTVVPEDFDGDGTTETLAAELEGLVERSADVTVTFQVGTSPLKVTKIVVNDLADLPITAQASASPTATLTAEPTPAD
jgi:hypothetical protein